MPSLEITFWVLHHLIGDFATYINFLVDHSLKISIWNVVIGQQVQLNSLS